MEDVPLAKGTCCVVWSQLPPLGKEGAAPDGLRGPSKLHPTGIPSRIPAARVMGDTPAPKGCEGTRMFYSHWASRSDLTTFRPGSPS